MNGTTPWRIAGASVIGTSHTRTGTECQDTWAYSQANCRASPDTLTAVCVSDGAGSVTKALSGAKLVACAVSNWLREHFLTALLLPQDEIGRLCLANAKRLVGRAAARTDCPSHEYAATLVAVCTKTSGEWLALHLGDGGIIGEFGGHAMVISLPEKGEFANESWFVTCSDAREHLRVYGSPFNSGPCKPTGFIVFSDGVENSLLDRRTGTVANAASLMLGWLRTHSAESVASALDQNIRTVFQEQSSDDCTIVLMAKPEKVTAI